MTGGDFYDPIYKGCTSPSTAFGVPMLPFILGSLVFVQVAILGGWLFGTPIVVMVAMCYGVAFSWARRISRHDEQRLLQLILKLRMRLRQRATRRLWGAISFAPNNFRR